MSGILTELVRYWPPAAWSDEEQEAICSWITKHGLDPNETRAVAVEFNDSEMQTGRLFAEVFELDEQGNRWINWATDQPASRPVVVGLVEPPPVPGKTSLEA